MSQQDKSKLAISVAVAETPIPVDTSEGEVEKNPIYSGQGSPDDPYVVEFQPSDPKNPINWSTPRKWFITTIVTLSVFAVTLTSSAYAESANEVIADFDISAEVFIIGVSVFVLGFAIGPAIWGPLASLI